MDLEEAALKDRLVGTVWEPGRLAASPGLLSSDQVVEGMRSAIFSEFTVEHAVWHSVRQKLKPLAIWQLQAFFCLGPWPWHCLGFLGTYANHPPAQG